MEGESGVTRSIIHEFHSSEIEGEQMEGSNGVTRSIIDEILSSDIQGDQMEGKGCVTRSIIDELHSSDTQKVENKTCCHKYLIEICIFCKHNLPIRFS